MIFVMCIIFILISAGYFLWFTYYLFKKRNRKPILVIKQTIGCHMLREFKWYHNNISKYQIKVASNSVIRCLRLISHNENRPKEVITFFQKFFSFEYFIKQWRNFFCISSKQVHCSIGCIVRCLKMISTHKKYTSWNAGYIFFLNNLIIWKSVKISRWLYYKMNIHLHTKEFMYFLYQSNQKGVLGQLTPEAIWLNCKLYIERKQTI